VIEKGEKSEKSEAFSRRGGQLKHGSGVGSASMPMKPGMALRRVDRRTREAAVFQSYGIKTSS
jgi:hypothetical protein